MTLRVYLKKNRFGDTETQVKVNWKAYSWHTKSNICCWCIISDIKHPLRRHVHGCGDCRAGGEVVPDRVRHSPNCLESHSYLKQWFACPGFTLCLHSTGNVSTLPLALVVFKEAKVIRTTCCHARFKHHTSLNHILLSCNAEHSPCGCLPQRCVRKRSHNRVSTFRWPDSLTVQVCLHPWFGDKKISREMEVHKFNSDRTRMYFF